MTIPIRELKKKNAKFEWTEKHQRSIQRLDESLIIGAVKGHILRLTLVPTWE